ncbi:hypothetical protein [Sorangium sp. So ce1099]|uniref:hypothetical protein n=1 Tax=Sorangium sp. So ce1099 TaxID=3133331 RepID=UPI003F5EDDCE
MNHQMLAQAVGTLALTASSGLLVSYFLSVTKELKQARREVSRFPLFAARSKLVQLVAEDKIREDDPAWRNLYGRVNFLLRIDNRFDALDLAFKYVKSQREIDKNPEAKLRYEQMLELEKQAAARIPEFRSAVRDVNRAVWYMVRSRTTRFHLLILYGLSFGLYGLSFGISIVGSVLKGGVSSARAVERVVTNHSDDNLIKWQVVDGEAVSQLGSTSC